MAQHLAKGELLTVNADKLKSWHSISQKEKLLTINAARLEGQELFVSLDVMGFRLLAWALLGCYLLSYAGTEAPQKFCECCAYSF